MLMGGLFNLKQGSSKFDPNSLLGIRLHADIGPRNIGHVGSTVGYAQNTFSLDKIYAYYRFGTSGVL